MIETSGLTKRYRRVTALGDCTISVPGGRISALVGPNGAGKAQSRKMTHCDLDWCSCFRGGANAGEFEDYCPDGNLEQVGLLRIRHPGLDIGIVNLGNGLCFRRKAA